MDHGLHCISSSSGKPCIQAVRVGGQPPAESLALSLFTTPQLEKEQVLMSLLLPHTSNLLLLLLGENYLFLVSKFL